jgi:hypothetical protein
MTDHITTASLAIEAVAAAAVNLLRLYTVARKTWRRRR